MGKLGVVMAVLLCAVPALANNSVISADGRFIGSSDQGVARFAGIRFAQPPVGELRWQPPVAVNEQFPQIATEFGNACMQTDRLNAWVNQNSVINGGSAEVNDSDITFSEDCLFLNVWAPVEAENKSLPVMVFIHGGSNRNGFGHEAQYSGVELADRDVILVTINYRLNVFGWYTHKALNAESPLGVSGNYGLLDQIEALRWVSKNIHSFGGDPNNVTVFGQSAGGRNITALLTSPYAKGLFNRAIVQGVGIWDFTPLKESLRLSSKLSGLAKQAAGKRVSGRAELAALRSVSAQDLFAWSVEQGLYADNIFKIVNDGVVIPVSLDKATAAELNTHSIMVGHNAEEYGNLYLTNRQTLEKNQSSSYPGKNRPSSANHKAVMRLLEPYPDNFSKWTRYLTAMVFSCSQNYFAANLAAQGIGVYKYVFTYLRTTQDRSWGVGHSFEIPYIFGNFSGLPGDEVDREVEQMVQQYWVDFATTGNPNRPGTAVWKPSSARAEYLDIRAIPTLQANFDGAICRAIF